MPILSLRGFCRGLLLAIALAGTVVSRAATIEVLEAQIALTDAATPPELSAQWSRIALPHEWEFAANGTQQIGIAWYRIALPVEVEPGAAYAVRVPRVGMHLTAFMNSQWIGGTETGAGSLAAGPRQPWLFTIPPGLMRGRDNTLHLRVAGVSSQRSGVSRVTVGPLAELRGNHERDFFLRVTLVQWLNAIVTMLAVFALYIWWRRPRERALLWFALAAALWVLSNYDNLGAPPLLPEPLWSALTAVALGWAVIAATLFANQLSAAPRALRTPLAAYALIGLGAALLYAQSQVSWPLMAWYVPLTLLGAYAVWLMFSAAHSRRSVSAWLILAAGIAVLALGVHDLLLLLGQLSFEDIPWMPYGIALLFVAVGAMLAERFVASLTEVEALNTTLEARVEQKHQELEASYALTRELETRNAQNEERQRLTRDVHDGLGGQLTSALAMAQRGGLDAPGMQQVLRDCIDDMRLLIDTLEPGEGDLVELLGNLRYRLEPRLAALGTRLLWKVGPVPPPATFSPRDNLQALRIVQEALNNAIKHGRPNVVSVSLGLAGPGHFTIAIEDDGANAAPVADPSLSGGKGLLNMQRRAEQIGASLSLEPLHPGMRVFLRFPGEKPHSSPMPDMQ